MPLLGAVVVASIVSEARLPGLAAHVAHSDSVPRRSRNRQVCPHRIKQAGQVAPNGLVAPEDAQSIRRSGLIAMLRGGFTSAGSKPLHAVQFPRPQKSTKTRHHGAYTPSRTFPVNGRSSINGSISIVTLTITQPTLHRSGDHRGAGRVRSSSAPQPGNALGLIWFRALRLVSDLGD